MIFDLYIHIYIYIYIYIYVRAETNIRIVRIKAFLQLLIHLVSFFLFFFGGGGGGPKTKQIQRQIHNSAVNTFVPYWVRCDFYQAYYKFRYYCRYLMVRRTKSKVQCNACFNKDRHHKSSKSKLRKREKYIIPVPHLDINVFQDVTFSQFNIEQNNSKL